MGESFTVNSPSTLKSFHDHVDKLFGQHKYLTFTAPRIGADRSIDQNSLLHVWLTELAAYLANCHRKEVTEGMIEGLKRSVKGMFYRETGYAWMVHKVICPLTKREKTDYSSSKSWKQGEMFIFLNWLQVFGAKQGCILESKGEHAKLTREQNQ